MLAPVDAYEQVRRICARLPEVVETSWDVGVRFKIRNRIVVDVFDIDDVTLVVFSVDPEERHFLLAGGHPWFPLNATDKRVGVVVEPTTDWGEIAELVTESYRLTAPKKLVALLDAGPSST